MGPDQSAVCKSISLLSQVVVKKAVQNPGRCTDCTIVYLYFCLIFLMCFSWVVLPVSHMFPMVKFGAGCSLRTEKRHVWQVADGRRQRPAATAQAVSLLW